MTTLDLALAGLVVVGTLWGVWHGALRQIGDAVAWIASFVVPSELGGTVAHRLQGPLAAPFLIVYLFTVVGLGIIAQIVTRLVFAALRTAWLKRRPIPATVNEAVGVEWRITVDRGLGAVLGATKMVAFLWFILSLLALAEAPLAARGMTFALTDAGFYRLAARYNAIGWFFGTDIRRLDAMLRNLRSPEKVARRRRDAMDALSRDPRVKAMTQDDSLRRAISAGDPKVLGHSSDVLSLLTDPEAMKNVAIVAEAGVERLAGEIPSSVR